LAQTRKFPGDRLVELPALGRKQNHFLPRGGDQVRPDRFHGVKNRLRLQNHAFAAAKRTVIDGLVPVRGPGPQIVHPDLNHAGTLGPLDDAMLEGSAKELRENRQDMKRHKSRFFYKSAFLRAPPALRATPPE